MIHIGIISLRKYHHFPKDSAGEVLTAIFWMLWLVLAPVIGSMAVAEERRLGVMEGQLCLPVSRRMQFALKTVFTMGLGIFLSGVMPILLEYLAARFGVPNPALKPEDNRGGFNLFWLSLWVVLSASWLTLLGFYGSTLSRSFLQAVGFGIATFFISFALLLVNGDKLFHGLMAVPSILPAIIAVPSIIITLLWLAYLNFKNFRPGWPLWWRNLLGFAGAFVFVIVTSAALYNRVWEVFEPAEPPHGPAIISLANPSTLNWDNYNNLCIRLPDGRVWFDYLDYGNIFEDNPGRIKLLWYNLTGVPIKCAGAQRFLAGSNWVSVPMRRVDFLLNYKESRSQPGNHVVGYLDTVGVRTDGTLWLSDASKNGAWTGDKMHQFGNETNWQQVVRARDAVLLLKQDGTLWCWGTNRFDWSQWQTKWPSLHNYQPYQIGTGSDWKEIFHNTWINFAQKSDGRVWEIGFNDKTGKYELGQDTRRPGLDQASLETLSLSGNAERAYVRPNGTLWMSWEFQQSRTNRTYSNFVQVGKETDWSAVALTWRRMVALKTDGSLWEWHFNRQWDTNQEPVILAAQQSPARLGSHKDWVAIDHTWNDVIALAADGSLWLWPNREGYESDAFLLKLPKQPQPLGNIFSQAN